MTTIRKFKWFWAWEDEKEEAWLSDMARQGWHLRSLGLPGYYTFEAGPGKNYVFRMDYFIDSANKPGYLQLFKDAGWDYFGELGGWQYFGKEASEGSVPEIFSDHLSKAKKYERLLFILVALLPIYIFNLTRLNQTDGTSYSALSLLMFVILVFYGYTILRLGIRVQQLKKKL